ncbi:methionine--tRNA ligase [Myxococcota bacterium]|nr:methionine--tRNA ligase [Myxococcota bacterium]
MTDSTQTFYITTPIYYVNDRPHIGHLYTTTVADVVARIHRLAGEDTFFLTGTDEHAAKVVDTAAERGMSAQAWADQNAEAFRTTFERFGISNDDFIRTSEARHKAFVTGMISDLVETGDVYLGEYEGWYDAGQEEYVPEARAAEHDFKSPINGKSLVRRKEENYFFRLSAFSDDLLAWIDANPEFIQPVARRNEVLGRIREGLADVPISRSGGGDWGIPFPGRSDHMIYVWIDALINYTSTVEAPERRKYWPANLHLIAKDILWFHAVIWPAMLMAIQKAPGREWMKLPRQIYAHSFWIRDGQKMSKSLGNFVDLEKLDEVVEKFGLDALRWYLLTQGPLGTDDGDFSDARFLAVYNSDLANTLGNSFHRISNMTGRYLGGCFEEPSSDPGLRARVEEILGDDRRAPLGLGGLSKGLDLVRAIDAFIEETQPFKLAKQEGTEERVAEILYSCAETYRLASLLLWPTLPQKMEEVWRRMGLEEYTVRLADPEGPGLADCMAWGGLSAGASIEKGPPLFARIQDE